MGKTKSSKKSTPKKKTKKCSCGGTHFISIDARPMFGDCSLSQEVDGKVTEFVLDEDEDGDEEYQEEGEETEKSEEVPDTFDKLGVHVSYSGMSVEISMDICVGCRKVQ